MGGGVSYLRNIQNPEHDPKQPALANLALSRELDKAVDRGVCQTYWFCDSVSLINQTYRYRHLKRLKKSLRAWKSRLFFFFFCVYDLIKSWSLSRITAQSWIILLQQVSLLLPMSMDFLIQTNIVKAPVPGSILWACCQKGLIGATWIWSEGLCLALPSLPWLAMK